MDFSPSRVAHGADASAVIPGALRHAADRAGDHPQLALERPGRPWLMAPSSRATATASPRTAAGTRGSTPPRPRSTWRPRCGTRRRPEVSVAATGPRRDRRPVAKAVSRRQRAGPVAAAARSRGRLVLVGRPRPRPVGRALAADARAAHRPPPPAQPDLGLQQHDPRRPRAGTPATTSSTSSASTPTRPTTATRFRQMWLNWSAIAPTKPLADHRVRRRAGRGPDAPARLPVAVLRQLDRARRPGQDRAGRGRPAVQ